MIDVEKANGIWTVTINRPDKANSLTTQMIEDLIDVATKANGACNAFILTGAGRVFSAGADLEEAHNGLATSDVWERLSAAVAALPCLTIAALNGTLAGGANGMALACDLRIAVPQAKFFYPVMALGFLPQPSDPVRLKKLVGPARAKYILMAGQKISAQEAYAFGLIDQIVEDQDVIEAAYALCGAVGTAAPSHVAAIKAMIDEGSDPLSR
ncbi:MAG: enoyl-CoA hydratase/isomerase family protein [Halocynthiibacter sp.]